MQKLQLPLKLTLSHFQNAPQVATIECPCQPGKPHHSNVLSLLKIHAQTSQNLTYSGSFVTTFLLLKLNNLAKFSEQSYRHFKVHLTMFYNSFVTHNKNYSFKQGSSGKQLLAQILLESGSYNYLSYQQIQEILDSNGMITATAIEAFNSVEVLLKKSEQVTCLGLNSLHARINPFVAIVHKDKNHSGESIFAANIYQNIHLNPKLSKPNIEIIQDAYSLRCTPQVHGVAYDIMTQMKNTLQSSLNKPQAKYITINGIKQRNLLYKSQTQTTLLDSLVCSLNEIGHMSFLRTQRMLNKFLTKNNISSSTFYPLMSAKLKKLSTIVGNNKRQCNPTNAETVILDNYAHDIFADEASPLKKITIMIQNIKQLLKLETVVSIQILDDIYGQNQAIFQNGSMQKLFTEIKGYKGKGYESLVERIGKWLNQ